MRQHPFVLRRPHHKKISTNFVRVFSFFADTELELPLQIVQFAGNKATPCRTTPSVARKFDFFTYKSLARCEAFVLTKSIGFEIDYSSTSFKVQAKPTNCVTPTFAALSPVTNLTALNAIVLPTVFLEEFQ